MKYSVSYKVAYDNIIMCVRSGAQAGNKATRRRQTITTCLAPTPRGPPTRWGGRPPPGPIAIARNDLGWVILAYYAAFAAKPHKFDELRI